MTPTTSNPFSFDFYQFQGRGQKPILLPTVDQANFLRSRFSIEEPMLDSAIQRVTDWANRHGINATPKKPYPSSQAGKFWLEFRVGGLTL
jgi:hypothetical protein